MTTKKFSQDNYNWILVLFQTFVWSSLKKAFFFIYYEYTVSIYHLISTPIPCERIFVGTLAPCVPCAPHSLLLRGTSVFLGCWVCKKEMDLFSWPLPPHSGQSPWPQSCSKLLSSSMGGRRNDWLPETGLICLSLFVMSISKPNCP